MANGKQDPFDVWFKRALRLTGLAVVVFIIGFHTSVDPYMYPIIALMLGLPIAGWAEGLLKRGTGNGNGKT